MLSIQIITGGRTPVYRQIIDQVRSSIATGVLDVGAPIPSVRGLAAELVVNPNTIAKAYAALVRDGVIESQQGRGYFVCKPREIYTKRERERRLQEAMSPFVSEAVTLGFSSQQIVDAIKDHFAELKRSPPKSSKANS